MEQNAYAELKSARDAARTEYKNLSDSERAMKRTVDALNAAGQTLVAENVASLRKNVQAGRIAAQEAKEALEAQVNAARSEYRQEQISAYVATQDAESEKYHNGNYAPGSYVPVP